LAAFPIEGIAVAVAGGLAENADASVVVKPSHLAIVGDIAPENVTADSVPDDAFGPEQPGMEPLNRRIADLVLIEARVQDQDIRVRVTHRALSGPIAFGRGAAGGRSDERDGAGEGASRAADKCAPVQDRSRG
jgi:hypothetical protein